MPKKKREETQAEQSARFKAEVERLIAAGELRADEADAALDKIVLAQRKSVSVPKAGNP